MPARFMKGAVRVRKTKEEGTEGPVVPQHFREEYLRRVMMFRKEVQRKRAEATGELVSFRAYRGDSHVHSNYSDSTGTVRETKAYADAAGLDFLFITDHNTIDQKRTCRKLDNVWWGQEQPVQRHHLVMLGLNRKQTPTRDLAHEYRRVQELGGVAFIAHPTGWFPNKRYSQQEIDVLNGLGDEFAIEVINGANQVFDCFDETDEMAVQLWDKHLSLGKRVVGMGCSDAHLAEAMGDVWTGVLARRCTKEDILQAIRRGHCYASDGPALSLWLAEKRMGDTAKCPKGQLTFRYECADSRGLDRIRLVSNGRTVKTIAGRGTTVARGEMAVRFSGGRTYYRLECFSVDERRAYGNPVYVRER